VDALPIKPLPDYTAGEHVGGGGQANIYKVARKTAPNGPFFAWKLYTSTSELVNARGRAEAQVLDRLKKHRGLPSHWPDIVDKGSDQHGRFWLVYDWIEGEDLCTLFRDKALSLADRFAIAIACCDALSAWHARGFVHRDIKPSNIIVRRLGDAWHAVIIDGGLALDTTDAQLNRAAHTLADGLFGTPGYRHRALLEAGSAAARPTDDVFALGASLYELFAGLPLIIDSDLRGVPQEGDERQQQLARERAFWNTPEHPSLRGRLRRCLDDLTYAALQPRFAEDDAAHTSELCRLQGPLGEALDLVLLGATHETYSWIYRTAAALKADLQSIHRWMDRNEDLGAETLPELAAAKHAPWERSHKQKAADWWKEPRTWRHATHEHLMQRHQSLCRGAQGLIRLNDVAAARGVLDSIDAVLQDAWEVRHMRLAADGAILALRGHARSILSAAFSPDGTRVITASRDETARVWDASTGQEIAILRGHDHGVTSAAFSPDGTRVVTGSWDDTARVWDASTGKQLALLGGHESSVNTAAFSPDGTLVVTASSDKTARVWDACNGQQLALLSVHVGSVFSAAFSPDGTRVVTASEDETAWVWDASTELQPAPLVGHKRDVLSAAFSPDGTRVVTASQDNTARVWDASTRKQLAILGGHDGWVLSATFSPDSARVVTASHDTTARVWDTSTGQELARLRGHDSLVSSAAFSPDGTRVVTASSDGTARVWDTSTGQELARLRGHDSLVTSAAFSPDGTRVVTASADNTARVWHTVPWLLRQHEPRVPPGAPKGFSVSSPIEAYAHTWVLGLRAKGKDDREIAALAQDTPNHTPNHHRAIAQYLKRFPQCDE
jgi:WD40 repeat protein/serine/threonine protein kinase